MHAGPALSVVAGLALGLLFFITACGGEAGPLPTPTAPPTPSPAATAAPVSPVPAQTRTITLQASKDNTLYEDAEGALSNGAGEHLFVGATNNRSLRRALIAFALRDIPAGSTITSVRLTLHVSRTQAGATDIELRRVRADWGQGASNASGNGGAGAPAATGDATWVHRFFNAERWQRPGGDFASVPSATASVAGVGPYTWGPTPQMIADLQAWLNSPSSNFGWALIGNEGETQTTKRFDSRETPAQADRPTLVVHFIPPP